MLRSGMRRGWRPALALPQGRPARAGGEAAAHPLVTRNLRRFVCTQRFPLGLRPVTSLTPSISSRSHFATYATTDTRATPSEQTPKPPSKLKTLPGTSITVSEEEQKIFDYLVDVVKASNINSELRVAGGWVRDKLLAARAAPATTRKQREVDLDIALNNMMGQDFARYIVRYNRRNSLPETKIGIVKINPAKSKHLETAVMSILGYSVDLVNLRTESYDSSRIPSFVGLGSPLQDSLRRDFTVNALYYNIRENRIEDHTGHGLADLEAGLLRTPDEPLSTLLEDPLRVLRAVRFKATLSFNFVPELAEALQKPEVHEALREKVSRQRVGLELNKMLSLDTEKALDALEQIAALDLHDVVFPVPPYLPQQTGHEDQGPQGFRQRVLQDATGAQVAVGSWSKDLKQTALQCLRENFRLLKDAPSGTELVQALPTLSESMPVGNGLALVSSFLLPALIGASSAGRARGASDKATELDGDGLITDNYYEDELTHNSYNRIRGNTEAVFKHALSLSNEHVKCVADVLIATKRLLPLIEQLETEWESARGAGQTEPLPHILHNNRVELGNWIRNVDRSTGAHAWETAARLAFVARMHVFGLPPTTAGLQDGNAFVQSLKDAGLVSLSETQPLLSGREIMDALQVKPSPFVGEAKAKLISWQLANLGRATKEEAIAYIKTLRPTSS